MSLSIDHTAPFLDYLPLARLLAIFGSRLVGSRALTTIWLEPSPRAFNAIIEGRIEREKGFFVATLGVRGGDGAAIEEIQSPSSARPS